MHGKKRADFSEKVRADLLSITRAELLNFHPLLHILCLCSIVYCVLCTSKNKQLVSYKTHMCCLLNNEIMSCYLILDTMQYISYNFYMQINAQYRSRDIFLGGGGTQVFVRGFRCHQISVRARIRILKFLGQKGGPQLTLHWKCGFPKQNEL